MAAGKTDKRRAPQPAISQDDLALWKHVTRKAEPLRQREAPRREDTPAAAEPGAGAQAPAKAQPATPAAATAPPGPRKPPPPPLRHGVVAGVDKRSAARLRRGQLPVEAALDLHGHTQREAHAALDRFLAEAQARSLRCVLIITGKGTSKEAGGVLRAQVPRWLNEPANRERILAFDHAQPKDGGLGALYVLMRRRKPG